MFQKENNLSVDGVIGKETLTKLKELYSDVLVSDIHMAHFLGQCHVESGGFEIMEENLNYSRLGLLRTFNKYFDEETATEFANKPEAIANIVYGDRMGNNKTGDGWKYRGRGIVQLTGKENYKKFSDYIGVDCVKNPDLILKKYYFQSAIWYFKTRVFLNVRPLPLNSTNITLRVNGGAHAKAERDKQTKFYYDLIVKNGIYNERVG